MTPDEMARVWCEGVHTGSPRCVCAECEAKRQGRVITGSEDVMDEQRRALRRAKKRARQRPAGSEEEKGCENAE